ncbi:hypothetical protein V474_00855 [Novosphingobium barchaimii LL02]|uniref:Uncharacterized protein n=1 Tax=Novosphingobium barchaimii LL02 TaxID=1114963 RepID=A0A0J8B253_9SPHN|nr:hypothetical protein V474_00855 [Novosphingobium barchaimii LL02]
MVLQFCNTRAADGNFPGPIISHVQDEIALIVRKTIGAEAVRSRDGCTVGNCQRILGDSVAGAIMNNTVYQGLASAP